MCGEWGADVHHLSAKSLGGSKCKDYIENLICLCRSCHDKCHSDKQYNIKARVINLRDIADKLESEYL
jgi:predicted HNH restriction endonuclease